MTSRRSASLRGTILLGISLMPVVFAITFFGLILATDAMGFGTYQGLEEAARSLLGWAGLIPQPNLPAPVIPGLSPSPSPSPGLETEPAFALEGASPTERASSAATRSPSSTPSVTPSETPTMTDTPTLTPTATSTSTPTASPSASPSPTRTPTVTPSRTRTPTIAPTQTPLPTESATLAMLPTEGAASPTPTSPATPSTCAASDDAGIEGQVVELVNTERIAQGLVAYSVDSRLRAAARVHATDMACNHFTSHTGSDGSSVRDRVEAQGYAWSWIGENYYVTGNTEDGAQVAFDWWMDSTPHRNNLLSPNYTQFGVGYVYDAGSDYGGYFVVVFARPQ